MDGAGPVPESLHLILNVLAKARGQFKLPSLKPFSSLFYLVLNLMKFGEHRGGMFVQIKGTIKGQAVTRSWHLLAEGDDGPYIPSMAIEAIVRKWINGDTPGSGARPATKELSLDDYDKLFEKRTIYTGLRCSQTKVGSLYQQILGSSFDKLPTQLQAIHSPQKKHQWVGHAKVVRGNNPFARIVAHLIGFPVQTSRTPVSVTFTPKNNSELWVRKFGEKTFRSFQKIGTGRNNYLLTEHFGLITVALALVLKNNRLYLVPRRWSMLGIPLPKFLLPNGESFEQEKDGIFQFNVSIKAPLIGLIVSYQGSLKPSVN